MFGGSDRAKELDKDIEKKIFVGSLSWETNADDLKEYFNSCSDNKVTDATVVKDQATGKSRGFGFVTFESEDVIASILKETEHKLGGRTIYPRKANRRGPEPIKKVFVGGLDPSVPEDDIRAYFGTFGTVENVELPYDKASNSRRAFVFVTFDSEESADAACRSRKHTIEGKTVDVKKAVPKEQQQGGGGAWGQGGGWGGPGGRGRGGGGYNNGWGDDGYSGGGGYGGGYGNYDQGGWGGGYNNYGQGGGYGGYSQGGGYDYNQGGGYGRGGGGYGGGGRGGYNDYSNY